MITMVCCRMRLQRKIYWQIINYLLNIVMNQMLKDMCIGNIEPWYKNFEKNVNTQLACQKDPFLQERLSFWDGRDSKLLKELMQDFYKKKVFEIIKWLKSSVAFECGICHEVSFDEDSKMCVEPALCKKSWKNRLCAHTNNAMVWNEVDILLYTLFRGGLIERNEFITYASWIRAYAHLLYKFDRKANRVARDVGCVYYDNFCRIFSGFEDIFVVEDTPESTKRRNWEFQRIMENKWWPFLRFILDLIESKSHEIWIDQWENIDESNIAQDILLERNKFIEVFFTSQPPIPPKKEWQLKVM